MRLAMMALIGAAMLPGASAGRGQAAEDVFEVWGGACDAGSHIADAKGKTPYPCNALIRIAMAADPAHEQLIFVVKGDDGQQNGKMLSVGGMIDGKGNLQIQRVQFTPGESTPIAPGGSCAIAREGAALKRLRCSATASDGSGHSLALDFAATGRVEMQAGKSE